MSLAVKQIIEWYKFHPMRWGQKFDQSRCAYSVHDTGRSVGFHQCCRKPKEEVGGQQWCKAHAEIVRSHLPLEPCQ